MSETRLLSDDACVAATRRVGLRAVVAASLLWTAALAGLGAGNVARAQELDSEMLSILAEMTAHKHQFRPDRLHALGVRGLSAVLDELLPDTAAPRSADVPEQTVAELIERLGHESYRVRETASQQLQRLGPGIKDSLIEATSHADAEVSWRAARILRRWQRRKTEDKGGYVQAFAVYAAGIDDSERLEELVRRTIMAAEQGVGSRSRSQILRQCIATIAASGKDETINRLKSLLSHEEVAVAVLITRAVGAVVRDDHCPELFLDALQDDRPEVVSAAIGYARNCGDGPRKSEVKRLLIAVFEGAQEANKFQATVPLAYTFEYQQARDYLLEQARAGDRSRQLQSLRYLADSRNRGKVANRKLLDGLVPLLKSQDNSVRRAAVRTLAAYSGEEVVSTLLPLLTDAYALVPREVKRGLQRQPDQKMVRRVVAAVAEQHADASVRNAAAELLKELDEPK